VGVFRDLERPVYEDALADQIVTAQKNRGPGDLMSLITQTGTWEID